MIAVAAFAAVGAGYFFYDAWLIWRERLAAARRLEDWCGEHYGAQRW